MKSSQPQELSIYIVIDRCILKVTKLRSTPVLLSYLKQVWNYLQLGIGFGDIPMSNSGGYGSRYEFVSFVCPVSCYFRWQCLLFSDVFPRELDLESPPVIRSNLVDSNERKQAAKLQAALRCARYRMATPLMQLHDPLRSKVALSEERLC